MKKVYRNNTFFKYVKGNYKKNYHPMNVLFIREGSDTFVRQGNYSTYKAALNEGARIAPFNFYIDTGSRIPTREEQLGEEVKVTAPRKNKIKALIDSL